MASVFLDALGIWMREQPYSPERGQATQIQAG